MSDAGGLRHLHNGADLAFITLFPPDMADALAHTGLPGDNAILF